MLSNKEIVSEMENISSVLLDNAVAYYIPDFQRNFVWGEEEIKQLIEDFNEDTENFSVDTNKLEGYLLGNIVLIDEENKKIVVDLQFNGFIFCLNYNREMVNDLVYKWFYVNGEFSADIEIC